MDSTNPELPNENETTAADASTSAFSKKEEVEITVASPNTNEVTEEKYVPAATTTVLTADKLDSYRLFSELVDSPEGVENLKTLYGGIPHLAKMLNTDLLNGLTEQQAADNAHIYGVNKLEAAEMTSWCSMFWGAFNDVTIIILCVAAIVSLVIGIVQFKEDELGIVDGIAIIVTVLIVALVGSCNDYAKEKQFRALNERKESIFCKVIRDGVQRNDVSIYDIVVGDIVVLVTGDKIPADGILVENNDLKTNESLMTGEPIDIRKDIREAPFMIGSCLVSAGSGRMLVTGVGSNSRSGSMMEALAQKEEKETPLQEKLDSMAKLIGYIGMGAAIITFIALVLRWCASHNWKVDSAAFKENGVEWLDFFIVAVTIIVVAVPEGLPLAVTISLAYSMKKMMSDNCLVRRLEACETMGSATSLCTDKTGTLTKNEMLVVRVMNSANRMSAANELDASHAEVPLYTDIQRNGDRKTNHGMGTSAYKDYLALSCCLNSNADFKFDYPDLDSSSEEEKEKDKKRKAKNSDQPQKEKGIPQRKAVVTGNKSEGALIVMCSDMGYNYNLLRSNLVCGGEAQGAIQHLFDFSSERKRMSAVINTEKYLTNSTGFLQADMILRSQLEGKYLCLTKGASEIILDKCSRIYDAESDTVIEMTDEMRDNFANEIEFYARQALRTLVIAYRLVDKEDADKKSTYEVTETDPEGNQHVETVTTCNYANANYMETDLVLLALVGIEDELRPGVPEAVADCKRAEIAVRMVTGDNIMTAIAIAKQCNILTKNMTEEEIKKHAITGPEFRRLTFDEKKEICKDIFVMARSSPTDKLELVKALMSQGEIVGSSGDGSNDAPQLRKANIGMAMGIAGTEVAKEAAAICIMDDNFATIVRAVEWGRTVMKNIRAFLQFQLTVNIVALIISFISSAVLGRSPLTAIQLLYVNLIMDSLGSLALATEEPSADVLDRKPIPRGTFLLSANMVKNMFLQALWQLIIMGVLVSASGNKLVLFERDSDHWRKIFHAYVAEFSNGTAQTCGNPAIKAFFDSIGDNYNALTYAAVSVLEGGQKCITAYEHNYIDSCLYNFFIFCQIWNEFPSRRIYCEYNFFKNIFHTPSFMIVIIITILVQILIMLCPGLDIAFNITPHGITGESWGICLVLSLAPWILYELGALLKLRKAANGEFPPSKKAVEKELKRAEEDARAEEEEAKERIAAIARKGALARLGLIEVTVKKGCKKQKIIVERTVYNKDPKNPVPIKTEEKEDGTIIRVDMN